MQEAESGKQVAALQSTLVRYRSERDTLRGERDAARSEAEAAKREAHEGTQRLATLQDKVCWGVGS